MGVDLRLLPLDHLTLAEGKPPWGFSHTVLNVPRLRDCWSAIEKEVPVEALPEGHSISSHIGTRIRDGYHEGEKTYGVIRPTGSYGDAFTWAKAGDIAPVLRRFHPSHPTTAYIAALPADTLVILDWH